MPFLTVEVSEKAFQALRGAETQIKEGSQDLSNLTTASATTLGNMLHYLERNKHKGKVMLVVMDEGKKRYSCQTPLDEIIPFNLLR